MHRKDTAERKVYREDIHEEIHLIRKLLFAILVITRMRLKQRRTTKNSNKIRLFFVLATFSLFLPNTFPISKAADQQLDFSFGNGGKVVTDFTGGFDVGNALAIQGDGKIIVGGSVTDTTTDGRDFGLARYNRNGSLDLTFGADGKVLTDVGGLGDVIAAIALQGDGKIVAAGFSFTENIFDFSVVRYLPNGALDTSFGNGGIVLTDFQNNDDEAFAIVIQPDGKIVVAGYTADSNFDLDFALIRYQTNGSLDNSFGSGGKVVTDFFGSDDQGFAMVRQADGKLIVAGAAINTKSFESEFALARYNEDGSLDHTFASDGKTTTAFENTSSASSLVLLPDGRIITAGVTFTSDESHSPSHSEAQGDFALVKYNADGSLDEAFGSGGKVTTDFSGEDDSVQALGLQTDGKIIAVGSAVTTHTEEGLIAEKITLGTLKKSLRPGAGELDPSQFALARYLPDGNLDASFGDYGKVTTELAADINIAFAAAIQGDGRIVAAGRAGDFERPDFGLARFLTADFDICLQEENNGNLLRFNSVTGDYQFHNCAKGISLAGKGAIAFSGCKITLTDSGANPKRPDRKVQALVNVCTKSGSATVLVISPSLHSEINDANFADNLCACRL